MNVIHNYDADREASLNRKIFNNCVKSEAMEDLCERPRNLIHKELRNQDLGTFTYKDIGNISRNIHTARSSQLLPLPTDIEETHEALNVVQVQTSSKEQFLLVNDSEKKIVMCSLKPTYSFLAPLMCFTLTGHSNQHRSCFTNYLQFMDSAIVTMCHLHSSYWPINIKYLMRIYSAIRYQRLQNLL